MEDIFRGEDCQSKPVNQIQEVTERGESRMSPRVLMPIKRRLLRCRSLGASWEETKNSGFQVTIQIFRSHLRCLFNLQEGGAYHSWIYEAGSLREVRVGAGVGVLDPPTCREQEEEGTRGHKKMRGVMSGAQVEGFREEGSRRSSS